MCQEYVEAHWRSFITSNFPSMMVNFFRQSLYVLCIRCLRRGMYCHRLFWPMILGKFVLVSSILWLKKQLWPNKNCFQYSDEKSVNYLAG